MEKSTEKSDDQEEKRNIWMIICLPNWSGKHKITIPWLTGKMHLLSDQQVSDIIKTISGTKVAKPYSGSRKRNTSDEWRLYWNYRI